MGKKIARIKSKPSNKKQRVRLKNDNASHGMSRSTKRSIMLATKKLGKSEDHFRILAEESPNMIFINQNGVVVYANKKCEEIMGYPVEELTTPNFNFMTLIAPSSQDLIQANFRKHSMGIDVPSVEYSLITKGGETIEAIITTKIIKYNRTNAILGIVTDISELKRDERMLKESESRLRQVIDLVPHFIFAKNRSGEFLLANKAVAQTYGTTVDELIGKTDYDFNHQTDEVTQFIKDDNEVMDTKRPKDVTEEIITRHDGTKRYLHTVKIPYQLAQTHADAILGVSIDITERKQAEEEKELILNSSRDLICIAGMDGYFKYVNPAWEIVLGYTKNELLSKPFLDFIHPEDHHKNDQEVEKLASGQPSIDFENRYIHKNGSIRIINWTATTIPDRKVMYCIGRDITERKRVEKELELSEQNYREIFNATSEAIFLHDATTGRMLDVNITALRMFGYDSKSEMFVAAASGYLSDGSIYTHEESLRRIRKAVEQGPQIFEWLARKKNGESLWLEISLRSTQIGGEGRVLAVGRDINERKQVEKALEESERSYREIFNSTTEAILIRDIPTGRILDFNDSFYRMHGYTTREEALADNIENLRASGPQYTHEEARRRYQLAVEQGAQIFEWQSRKKNGELFWVEISLRSTQIGGAGCVLAVIRDITERKRINEEMRVTLAKYKTLFEYFPLGITITNGRGNIVESNPTADKMLHMPSEMNIQADTADSQWHVVHSDGTPMAPDEQATVRAIKEQHLIEDVEMAIIKPDHSIIWINATAAPIPVPGGDIVTIYTNITERKLSQEALRESEERFRSAFQFSAIGVAIVSIRGRWLKVNPKVCSIIGYSENELLDKTFRDITHPDDLDLDVNEIHQIINNEIETYSVEKRISHKDGSTIWVILAASIVHDRMGDPLYFIYQIEDITERKQALKALQVSEETYRTIFENTGTATILIEADTLISLTNKEFENLSGYTKKEIEGKKKWTEFVHPDNLDFMLAQHKLRRESREAALNHYEFQFIDKSNNIHDIYLTIDVISGTKKSIASLLDITASKRATIELQKNEERFRSLIQNSADIITIHDQDMTIKYATPSITKSLGYTQSEIIGKNPLVLTHPEDVETIANEIKLTLDYKNPGAPTEFRIRHANGSWIYIESISNNQLQNPNINGIIVTSRDITEKKRTQLELEQLNDRLHALAANLQRVREEESTRIAREIHDELGQLLTGIKMDLAFLEEMLQKLPGKPREEILKRTHSTSDLTDRAIQSMRKITAELRPAILDTMGLSAAIEWQLEEFQHRTGIRCAYFTHTNPVDIDGACSTAIFRILQESLSNVVRHAKASNVIITLDQGEYELILEIQDDGQGITSRDLAKEKSFGILGMQERAWLLGGSFTINERITGGTTIHVQLPIHPNEPKE